MNIQIRHETLLTLEEYGQVPMVFTIRSRYRVELVEGGLGGWFLNEEPVDPPYEKDYDELVVSQPCNEKRKCGEVRFGCRLTEITIPEMTDY